MERSLRKRNTLIFLAAALTFVLAPLAFAGEMKVTLDYSTQDLVFSEYKTYDLVTIDGFSLTEEVGKPWLPEKVTYVALPGKVTAQSISYTSSSEELPGTYFIPPAPAPKQVGSGAEDTGGLPGMNPVPGSSLYPLDVVEFVQHSDLAGVGLACIAIRPLQYNERDAKLVLHSQIVITVHYSEVWNSPEPDRSGIVNYAQTFEPMLKDMVINPEEVQLVPSGIKPLGGKASQYEHVIITPASWVSYFEPLRDWYTDKGMPSNIVTREWVYANYSGSSNKARIRNFIISVSSSWGTLSFLLGGSPSQIPYDTSNYGGDTIPNDAYYSDYDDDWICEVFVGRASVTSTSEVSNFVNRILEYETNPPLDNYTRRVGLFGFDLDSTTHGEEWMEYFVDNQLPSDCLPVRVYDSHNNNHDEAVTAALNEGVVNAFHVDHANYSVIGMGYVNHGILFSLSKMNSFTNATKPAAFYSIGCWSAAMDYYNIGDAFVRNPNGGGIAYCGNTRYGWYNPGTAQTLSCKFMTKYSSLLYKQGIYQIGRLFAEHKNQSPPGGADINKYIWTELVLFGDPGVGLWTCTPMNPGATLPQIIYREGGSQEFKVLISRDGVPVPGRVRIEKADEGLYTYAVAGADGVASVDISPSSNGTLSLLITGKNCLPYETTCQIIDPQTSAPTISGVSPATGTELGGSIVTVLGNYFTSQTNVRFGGVDALGVVPITPTSVVCVTPPNTIGTVDVTVTTQYGSDTLNDGFNYLPNAPTVTMVDPDKGPFDEYTAVTVHGEYFSTTPDTTVTFGGLSATDVAVIDRNTLTCLAPPMGTAGKVDVVVSHSGGSGTLTDGFDYRFPAPIVDTLSPNYGTTAGGTLVTVTGDFFDENTVAFINVFGMETTVVDQHKLIFKTFSRPAGDADILILNFNGSCKLMDAYTFLDGPVCYYLGGFAQPGGTVALKVVAPDRAGQGVILCCSDQPGYTYFPPPHDFALNMAPGSIRVLYNSILNGANPKLNTNGEITLIVKIPSDYTPGTPIRFQFIVGTLAPVDLESSNYVDHTLD